MLLIILCLTMMHEEYVLLIVAHRLTEDNNMSLHPFPLQLRWLPSKRLFLNLNGSLLTCLIHKENEYNQNAKYIFVIP